jgi:hypothetical protein
MAGEPGTVLPGGDPTSAKHASGARTGGVLDEGPRYMLRLCTVSHEVRRRHVHARRVGRGAGAPRQRRPYRRRTRDYGARLSQTARVTTRSHQTGCTLYSVHWLRHAIGAAGHLANADPDTDALTTVDRRSAELLADTLAHFAELPDRETVTLLDVAEHATPLSDTDDFAVHCTCGRGRY